MNDKLNESLSALMDGEADDLELRRLLKALAEEDEKGDGTGSTSLAQQWVGYHRVGEVMRGAHSYPVAPGFLDRVNSALDEVPGAAEAPDGNVATVVPTAVAASNGDAAVADRMPWWRSMAVAATVAVAITVGVQQWQGSGSAVPLASNTAGDTVSQPVRTGAPVADERISRGLAITSTPVFQAAAVSSGPARIDQRRASDRRLDRRAEAERQLQEFLKVHPEYTIQQTDGVLTFVRMANLEQE